MGLGGDWNANAITNEDIKKAEIAIDAALEIGITYFDHADIYTLGKAETVFGKVLQKRTSLREKILLQSKAGIRLNEGFGNSNIYNASKTYLINQVDLMLKRLQTDYLDVFMLHRPDPLIHPEEVASTFRALKETGKVKKFGLSNMSLHQINAIQNLCDEPLIANQIELSLAHSLLIDTGVLVNRTNDQDYNGVEGLLEYMQENKMAIQAYSALAGGKYTGNTKLALEKDKKTIDVLNETADKYSTTSASILLAWLFKIPGTIQPIVGTTNPDRIRACKDAIAIDLSREDWYNLWISARGENLP